VSSPKLNDIPSDGFILMAVRVRMSARCSTKQKDFEYKNELALTYHL
jgi:hypothetical protein